MSARLDRAAVLAVGDELLAGAHADLNTPEIARTLAPLGIAVVAARVVSDDVEAIERAVRELFRDAPLVFVTGGLGPTRDDVTRDGVAAAFGRELVRDARVVEELAERFAASGIDMPAENQRQADVPEGATILANRVGTAPGFRLTAAAPGAGAPEETMGTVIVLPGPPAEMRVVLREEAVPWLTDAGLADRPAPEHRFHLFGLPESVFAERAGSWMDRDEDPRMGCTVKRGVLSVSIRSRHADRARAEALVAARADAFRERFDEHVFSEDDARLEHVFGRELCARGVSFSVAESCTGGMVAALVCGVPGISAVFSEAYVTYANEAKVRLLGVDAGLLAREGAVSRVVAEEMARGLAERTGARLSLAITGVAGPGGGTPEKPVGLVWFATCLDGVVHSRERLYPSRERDWIRTLAARMGLYLAWERLRELDG